MKARRIAVAVSAAAMAAMAGTAGVAHAQGGAKAAKTAATTAAPAAAQAMAQAAASGAAVAAAASGASAAAAALPVIGQYTVRAGQSLHDVAVDVTQSHDKTVLARASQALFDANPAAFMKHDPSRLRVGAVLNVPGTPDMASAAAAASAPAAGASAVAPAAAASAPVAAAPGAALASGATGASSATHAATTAAASASAAAGASAGTAANAGAVAASGAAGASASMEAGASAASAAASGASAATNASAEPASASDAHSWSGAIQAAPAAGAASGASATTGAAASAPVTVSSLQQLLALKNRVLMALQQHGIGKQAHVAGAPAGTAGSQGGAAAGGAALRANAAQPEVSPVTLGIVAALVLAFVALIVRLLMRKRRKPAPAADAANAQALDVPPSSAVSAATPASAPQPGHADAAVPPESLAQPAAPLSADAVAATAAAMEAAKAAEAARAQAESPRHDAALDRATDAASLSAAAELGGDALPPPGFEAQHGAAQDGPAELRADRVEHGTHPHGVEPGEPQSLADATDAASFAAAAELGASALPPEGLAGLRTVGEMEELARQAEAQAQAEADAAHEAANAEPRPIELTIPGAPAEQHAPAANDAPAPEAPTEPEAPAETAAPHLHAPAIAGDEAAPEAPPEAFAAPAVPLEQKVEMPHQEVPKLEVPQEFPKSAVDALGDLDMPLPPRVETSAPMPGMPISTEPVATPETIARQSLPFVQPPVPPAGEAIEAGTAGAGAIAGLGAPRFGALTLDFDLNLPADSAEPLPVFTPDQLSRIARNKLELAHEYIALGDLSGARALINEVIESNDHATRADAQALLSTLSPLS